MSPARPCLLLRNAIHGLRDGTDACHRVDALARNEDPHRWDIDDPSRRTTCSLFLSSIQSNNRGGKNKCYERRGFVYSNERGLFLFIVIIRLDSTTRNLEDSIDLFIIVYARRKNQH